MAKAKPAVSSAKPQPAATFSQLESRLGVRPLIKSDGTPKGFYYCHHTKAVRIDFKRNCPDRIQRQRAMGKYDAYHAYRQLVDELEKLGKVTEGEMLLLYRAVEGFFGKLIQQGLLK